MQYKKGISLGDNLSVMLLIASVNTLSFTLNTSEGYLTGLQGKRTEKPKLPIVDDLNLHLVKNSLDLITQYWPNYNFHILHWQHVLSIMHPLTKFQSAFCASFDQVSGCILCILWPSFGVHHMHPVQPLIKLWNVPCASFAQEPHLTKFAYMKVIAS